MSQIQKMLIAVVIAILAATGWMLRWKSIELHPGVDAPAAVFIMNRWTGEIRYVQGVNWMEVLEKKRYREEKVVQ